MNYEELSEKLKQHSVKLSPRTLRLHYRLGLLPAAKKQHRGQGRGWEMDFPDRAVFEAIANYRTMGLYRLKYPELAEVRNRALAGEEERGEMETYWMMQVVAAGTGKTLPGGVRPKKLSDADGGPFSMGGKSTD